MSNCTAVTYIHIPYLIYKWYVPVLIKMNNYIVLEGT